MGLNCAVECILHELLGLEKRFEVPHLPYGRQHEHERLQGSRLGGERLIFERGWGKAWGADMRPKCLLPYLCNRPPQDTLICALANLAEVRLARLGKGRQGMSRAQRQSRRQLEKSNNGATHPLVHLLGGNLLDLGNELVKAGLHLRVEAGRGEDDEARDTFSR